MMAGIMATRSISLSIEESLLAALDAQGGNRSAAVNEAIELWLSLRRIQALEAAYDHLASLEEGDLGAAATDAVGMGAEALGWLDD
jgi:Arc/MetJ-type ribon-helix-helix transcriptional regulator